MQKTFKIVIQYVPGDEFPWHASALGASVWAQGETPGEAADGIKEEFERNNWEFDDYKTDMITITVPKKT